MLRADRTRIPRTTYSGPCSSALLILQDLPALAGPAVALCTNFARILSVPHVGLNRLHFGRHVVTSSAGRRRPFEIYWMLSWEVLLCTPATVRVSGTAAPVGALGGTRKLIW